MKKLQSLFVLLITLFSLVSAFAISASAEDAVESLEPIWFEGIEVEYSGYNGIRGVFGVNEEKIAEMEAEGYIITYGAIVGYKSTYGTPSALKVNSKKNAVVIKVYEEGAKKDAYFLPSEEGVSRFAIATLFGPDADQEIVYDSLVYRGFMQIKRKGYTTQTVYADGISADIGEDISIYKTLCAIVNNPEKFGEDPIFTWLRKYQTPTCVYVDPAVSSSGDGLSEATAVKTVKEGYEKAVALINAATAPIDVEIRLASGKHHITDKIDIKGTDITATVEYSITFAGAETGEKSLVTSNCDIPATQLQKVDGKSYYSYQLPESAKIDGKYPAFRDLSFDGKQATLAVSKGLFHMTVDSCTRAEEYGFNAADRLLYVHPEALGQVEVDASGNVIGVLEYWVQTEWQVHCVRIEHINYTPVDVKGEKMLAIRVIKDDWDAFVGEYYSTLANRRYWFQNNKTYVDEPGEFWYHRDTGTIYCIPFTDIAEVEAISYPVLERLFHLQKAAKNITFCNLDLTGTTVNYISDYGYISGQGGRIKRGWVNPDTGSPETDIFLPYAAIYGMDVENIRISRCSFYAVGGDAINFRGAVDRLCIYGCSLEEIGSCGVRLGVANNYYNPTQHNTDVVIRENYMQDIARIFNSSTAILTSSIQNLDITHNTILDTAYSAISVGWSWSGRKEDTRYDTGQVTNVRNANIAYNYIENFMTKMQDGGAIYVLGGNASRYYEEYVNSMNHNYVVLTGNISQGKRQWTVFYHDGGASHWHDHDNVLVIDPKSPLPNHHYISYQSIAGQEAYSNLSERYYIIGYRPDYLAFRGTYDENGAYISQAGWDEATWKAYMPDWYDTKYPDWYQKWIVNGERPDLHVGWFIGFAVITNDKTPDRMETYTCETHEDGSITPAYQYTSEQFNYFRNIYLYTDFATAEGTVGGNFAKALAETAGCSSYHPKYGVYSAK